MVWQPRAKSRRFHLTRPAVDRARSRATAVATARAGAGVPLIVVPWADDLDRSWRDAVREGWAAESAWTCCWNVRELRVVDTRRPWGRRHVGFDLARCATDQEAFALLWGVLRAEAMRPTQGSQRGRRTTRGTTLLDEIVEAASAATEAVCSGLERGVRDALVALVVALASAGPPSAPVPPPDALLDQALTVVYRLLFLLFAEARALVPLWHRVYREGYSVTTLRDGLDRDPHAVGLWPALQAISRLARHGCRVGSLEVTPFNGHLFAPQRAPLAEQATIADDVLRAVLMGVTTTTVGRGRQARIAFGDLGVEQLGAIYERVLDHRLVIEPADGGGTAAAARHAGGAGPHRRRPPRIHAQLIAHRGDRKASATFYTPRSLADLIVRRTLAPLVCGASSERILRLRVVDPAMGSGAFLVSACQYLARAYEAAIVGEQHLRHHEIGERDRAAFRRLVARRCLYGVDRNPMAVQLARLSLWLATLAADVPLTFLDHHLRIGNSLIGATLGDLLRQAPGRVGARTPARVDALPLLAATEAMDALGAALPLRAQLSDVPDDTVEQIRFKEQLLRTLDARGAPLARWREAADLWCAGWFWRGPQASPTRGVYGELLSSTLGRGSTLPVAVLDSLRAGVREAATAQWFFHWAFEFPEVFWDGNAEGAGFDAVIGNPPWDMVRDEAADAGRTSSDARQLGAFVREAGIYAGAGDAHLNVYLLFVERALQLLRHGGRVGLVVPWGLAGDHGAARVRRLLLDSCHLDSWMGSTTGEGSFPSTAACGSSCSPGPVETRPGPCRSRASRVMLPPSMRALSRPRRIGRRGCRSRASCSTRCRVAPSRSRTCGQPESCACSSACGDPHPHSRARLAGERISDAS